MNLNKLNFDSCQIPAKNDAKLCISAHDLDEVEFSHIKEGCFVRCFCVSI
jgi:hypothetical protein